MTLMNLKDVSQSLEIARRCRRELPDGAVRQAMDRQLLDLTRHVAGLICEDERLTQRRRAEQELKAAAPNTTAYLAASVDGRLHAMIDQLLAGAKPKEVWKPPRPKQGA